MKYAYSTDEEHYEGECGTPEEAAEECFEMYGDNDVCYVGEVVEVGVDVIAKCVDTYSISVQISDNLGKIVGDLANEYLYKIPGEKRKELAALIAKWVIANYNPNFWSVANVREFKREQVTQ